MCVCVQQGIEHVGHNPLPGGQEETRRSWLLSASLWMSNVPADVRPTDRGVLELGVVTCTVRSRVYASSLHGVL